jgi:hypothetical protein
MRALADYVLRTRTDEVPVSPPVREEHPTRFTMGFAASDAKLVRHLAGEEAILVTNIQRPGEALARLRLVAVDPSSSRLIAEVVGTQPPEPGRPGAAPRPAEPIRLGVEMRLPEPVRPEAAPRTFPAKPRRGGKVVLAAAGATLLLLVIVALGWMVHARADRSCTSSSECPDGFACAALGNPEYRSCERACRSDTDCPGSEVCVQGGVDVRVCRANR